MSQDMPFEFCWGTFCRRILVDDSTKQASLIDIITAIKYGINFDNKQVPDSLPVGLGSIGIVAFFRRKKLQVAISEPISVKCLLPNIIKEIPQFDLNLEMTSDQDSGFLVINLDNLVLFPKFEEGLSSRVLKVIFSLNDLELACIELPIEITMSTEPMEPK
jgi:hypothetical protein